MRFNNVDHAFIAPLVKSGKGTILQPIKSRPTNPDGSLSFASPTPINKVIGNVTMMDIQEATKRLTRYYKDFRMANPSIVWAATNKHDDAPSSLEELQDEFAECDTITVAREGSGDTIYGHDGNVAFRHWHDYGHIYYGLEMTAEDEVKLVTTQFIDSILPRMGRESLPAHRQADTKMLLLYLADTVGQSLLCENTGHFPANQTMFTLSLTHLLSKDVIGLMPYDAELLRLFMNECVDMIDEIVTFQLDSLLGV